MKRIIFTADDFGLTPEVNAAVVRAHRDGVLTAASLMVAAPAVQEAAAIARMLPTLGVGLHVVVADGRPLLPPEQIPDLVDANGMLSSRLARAGARWFFSPKAQEQLKLEIAAQFDAFRATGLACDHVNAHNHMHLHPTVLRIIVELAQEHGIRHVRLPYEPAALACGNVSRVGSVALTPWVALMRRRLKRAGLSFNDHLAGLNATGQMNEARVLAALDAVGVGVTEFYFHPAACVTDELEAAAPGYDRIGELEALISPAVAHKIADRQLQPCVFRGLP